MFWWVNYLCIWLLLVKTRQTKKITFEINSCWYKNSRLKSTYTTNGIVKMQRKIIKQYIPEDPESDPSSSDSSLSESDSSDEKKYGKYRSKNKSNSADNSIYSKFKSKRCDKKKKYRKHTKQASSDSLLSNSDSSDEIDYKIKRRHKKKSCQKMDPIKLCPKSTEKFLTTAYKSRIIKFKFGEDPLQCRIYFLTFI